MATTPSHLARDLVIGVFNSLASNFSLPVTHIDGFTLLRFKISTSLCLKKSTCEKKHKTRFLLIRTNFVGQLKSAPRFAPTKKWPAQALTIFKALPVELLPLTSPWPPPPQKSEILSRNERTQRRSCCRLFWCFTKKRYNIGPEKTKPPHYILSYRFCLVIYCMHEWIHIKIK